MRAAISITSIPQRFGHLEKTLKSLIANVSEGLDIILYIPEGSVLKIPKMHSVDVRRVQDRGPFTKICYSSMAKEYDWIITADDDVSYPSDWAKGLMAAMSNDDGNAYGYRGRVLPTNKDYRKSRLVTCKSIKSQTKVDILTGTWGCIYNNGVFKENFLNPPAKFKSIDDIWINGYLAWNGVDRFCLPFKGNIQPTEAHSINSLWDRNSNGINNNKGIEHFGKYF